MEKINIAELLKDCPKGMEFDCTIWDSEAKVFLERVLNDDFTYPIEVTVKYNNTECTKSFTKYGAFNDLSYCKCVLFPRGKTTWEGFVPPSEFKDGDVVTSVFQGVVQGTGIFDYEEQSEAWIHVCITLNNEFFTDGYLGHVYDLRLATEEEKAKLFQAIKDNGYKWNAETKTLEKLVEPKFKVGDRVRLKLKPDYVYTIHSLTWDDNKQLAYRFLPNNDKHLILVRLNTQDNYELVPNNFDIATLKPFESRVLVRNVDGDLWKPAIYGFPHSKGCYVVGGVYWGQCIPYEENKELLGTTNNPEEYGSR